MSGVCEGHTCPTQRGFRCASTYNVSSPSLGRPLRVASLHGVAPALECPNYLVKVLVTLIDVMLSKKLGLFYYLLFARLLPLLAAHQ